MTFAVPHPHWFPLSAGQSNRWRQYQLDPASQGAHNKGFAVRIAGPLDLAQLRAALQALVDRHPMLRSRYREADCLPQQSIAQSAPVHLRCLGLEGADEALMQRQVQADCEMPFDLAAPPLLRAHWYRRGAGASVLLLVFEALACDDWSYWLLLGELGQLMSGTALAPRCTDAYAAHVDAQQAWLSSPAADAQWQYWQARLVPTPPLRLRTDFDGPRQHCRRRDSVSFTLPAMLVDELRTLGRKHASPLFSIMLAAYNLLLHGLTGQHDIRIGTPMPGRSLHALDELVGDLANPVVVRTHFAEGQSLAQLLHRVRDSALCALAREDFPFAELAQRLQPAPGEVHPLFQAAFVFQPARQGVGLAGLGDGEDAAPVHWGQLALQPFPLRHSGLDGRLALVLEVVELGDSLACEFKFDPDLYARSTVERWAGHLHTVLADMASHEVQQVDEISLLSAAQRRQLLAGFNSSARPVAKGRLLHQMIEAHAAATPQAIALIFDERTLSYASLNRRANQLAHRLLDFGIQPDDRVALCMEPGMELVIAMLAILKAGAAIVPLDPADSPQRLAFMLDDSRPAALLTSKAACFALPEELPATLMLDEPGMDIGAPGCNPDPRMLSLSDQNLALVSYTADAGPPLAGVMHHHAGLSNLVDDLIARFGIAPASGLLQTATSGADACLLEAALALGAGARLQLAVRAALRPGAPLLDTLRRCAPTHLLVTPAELATLPEHASLAPLQVLIVRGGPCPAALAASWSTGRRLFLTHGGGEAGICSTVFEYGDAATARLPIGRPVANVQAYVLDARLQPVPVGVAGELYFGGAGVARGYLHRPDLTAERFFDNPFSDGQLVRTGDLASWREDGNIDWLGRNDQRLTMRGVRIELNEISERLMACAGVHDALAVAHEDQAGRQQLVAYVVASQGVDLSVPELQAHMAATLPVSMVPSAIVVLDGLALADNGKLDHGDLPVPDQPGWA